MKKVVLLLSILCCSMSINGMLSRLQNYFRSWRKEKPELSQSRKSFIVQKEKIKPVTSVPGVKKGLLWTPGALKGYIYQWGGSIQAEHEVIKFLREEKRTVDPLLGLPIDKIENHLKHYAKKLRQQRGVHGRRIMPVLENLKIKPVKRTSTGRFLIPEGAREKMLQYEDAQEGIRNFKTPEE
jgi:hypothetical protein